jgi:hypothetical protein
MRQAATSQVENDPPYGGGIEVDASATSPAMISNADTGWRHGKVWCEGDSRGDDACGRRLPTRDVKFNMPGTIPQRRFVGVVRVHEEI